jgi:enamine deaminase RidA (YjgF/YER057c/UK114 family)
MACLPKRGEMTRTVHVPAGIFDSRGYGFAQVTVVATPHGDAVHVSGQVAWDAEQRVVGEGDIGRQLAKSLENLAIALASVGARLDQVGALRLYIKQTHLHDGKAISAALKAAFGDNPPCTTWIGVPGLASEEFLVEVEPSVVFLSAR